MQSRNVAVVVAAVAAAFEVECPRCHHVFSTRPCTNPRNRLYAALLRHFKRIHPGMNDRQRALAAARAVALAGLG